MAAIEMNCRDATGRPAASVHHVLDGLAGYYACEAAAQAMLAALHDRHGLTPAQLVLLSPRDARWPRFNRRARQWNRKPVARGQPPRMAVWLAAGVGALASAALAGSLSPIPDEADALLTAPAVVLAVLLTTLAGALAFGGAVAGLLRQQPQYRDFDRVIRRKLADGQWVVLAHDVPWSQQAAVVALVSRFSLNWSAVSSAHGRL